MRNPKEDCVVGERALRANCWCEHHVATLTCRMTTPGSRSLLELDLLQLHKVQGRQAAGEGCTTFALGYVL